MIQQHHNKHIKQKGAGLIEILATLFILSVGLLGIAALQATGIQAGQGASLRTSALLVVEDITSRMQANRHGVYTIATDTLSYNATTAYTGNNRNCSDIAGTLVATTCSPTQMAEHDIYLWKIGITETLPTGSTGEIVTNALAPITDGLVSVIVTITWPEKGATPTYESEFRVRGK